MGTNDDLFKEGATKDTMNFIFLFDTSGSMSGVRINQLNSAMPEVLSICQKAALEREVDLYVRMIEFNNDADWFMGSASQGIKIEEAVSRWKDLTAKSAGTNTAAAIRLSLEAMHTKYLGTTNYHPVVFLLTDGHSNSESDTMAATALLKAALTGDDPEKKDKVWRIAVGVQDYNEKELLDFAMEGKLDDGYGELTSAPMLFKVENIDQLAGVLKTITVSSLVSNTGKGTGGGLVIEEWDD